MASQITPGFAGPVSGSYTYNTRYPQGSPTVEGAQAIMNNYLPGWSVTGPTSSGYVSGLSIANPNGWNVATPLAGSTFITVPTTQGVGSGSFFCGFDPHIEFDAGDNLYYVYYTNFAGSFEVVSQRPEPPIISDSSCP
jgi:beta-xylosidase